ncbi:5-formyltetrahydrofolate cyclo-ligase, partial [Enterococcus faecium]
MEQMKEKLRRQGIEKLKNLAKSGKKKDKEQRIYEQLFASEYWKSAQVIGTTLSNEFELDTQRIIQRAKKEQKKIVVPKTLPKRQMAFYEMDEHTAFER